MTSTTTVARPPASSPLSAIQGTVAYGDGNPLTVTTLTYYLGNFSDTQTWTSEYKAEFRAALAAIEAVANIRFVETSVFGSADLVEAIAPSSFFDTPNTLGFHGTPILTSSDQRLIGVYNTDFWKAGLNSNGDPGGFFFTTLIHELGHALGLGHPHDDGLGTTVMNGVTAPFDSFGVGELNQGVYTVMSYNDGWTSKNGVLPANATYGGSTGLGALDIAALQAMYGANTSTNSGNDVYILPASNTAGVGYQAIWDTGGSDSIWYQGSANARIDLRPATLDYTETGGGVISFAAGIKGGFSIANGVVIENAYGGAGDDLIFGNNAQNILRGNSGNDTFQSLSDGSNNSIYGGYGNDTIYVAVGTGADLVFGEQGDDVAVITSNAGSFSGGTGTDIARFVSALSNYLFLNNGANYQFLNIVTKVGFSISSDVELIQFLNGAVQYDRSSIISATQLSDIDTVGITLKHANQGIYVVDAGNSNVGVTLNGQAVGQNSIAGWQAVQTQTYSNGFKLLWKHESGAFSEWFINSAGQFVASAGIRNVVDFETFYNVDLNGDSRIGHFSTLVENSGSTSLYSSTQEVYLLNDNIGLTLNGGLIGSNSLNGWQAVQAEATEGGYKVLWKNNDGLYSEWTVNSAGQFQSSNGVGNVIDVETFYDVDLNGDSRTGHFSTLVENSGSTSLYFSTREVYLLNDNIGLTLNGGLIGPNSLNGWQAVQAEAIEGGYKVLWKNNDGSYSEWTVNSAGQFQSSNGVGNVIDVETFYDVDLNGDSRTGHFSTLVENSGSTSLYFSTREVYLLNDNIGLTLNGGLIGPNSLNGWQAVQAEATETGYKVLWKNNDGSYSEWTVNSAGQFQSSNGVGNVIDVETFYDVDLNGDTRTGHFTTTIESNGSTTLASSSRGMYLINDTIGLKLNGADVGPDSFPGWQAIHAEAFEGGYRVLWKNSDGAYSEWTVNGAGEFVSSVAIDEVIDVESFYRYDLDGSGTVGYEEPKLSPFLLGDQPTTNARETSHVLGWDESSDELQLNLDLLSADDAEDEYALLMSGRFEKVYDDAVEYPGDAGNRVSPESDKNLEIEKLLTNAPEDDAFLL